MTAKLLGKQDISLLAMAGNPLYVMVYSDREEVHL